MNHSEQNRFMAVRDWLMDHSKIVMPLVLIVCVLITVVVAVNANQREALEKEAEQAAMAVAVRDVAPSPESLSAPELELEENTHPELNTLIRTYYDAQASGDIETITSLNAYLNEIETIRVQELSKYIDSYPVLDVYTKPGLEENSYVAYVYSEVQFSDVDQPLPGMQTYYIGMNEEGAYFINNGTYDDTIWNYIREVSLQDDVVDLNNKVVVEYNDMLAEDEELNEFIAYLKEKINEDVGEILAQAEQPSGETEEAAEAEPLPSEGEETAEDGQPVLLTVRATDVVNIRSSDSEEADRIDKAQIGQEFTLIEQRGNGWSKVRYNDRDAYIKSDYLETVVGEDMQTDASEGVESDEEPAVAQETETSSQQTPTGTVKVIESVRVRKSASTDAEVLGTAYEGDELELLMKLADGWTRVLYQGQTAYVKSDYVE